MILEEEGYVVQHMSNGKHIPDMENNLPDLLLPDIKLGNSDGKDICRRLRQDNFFDTMRIVLVSAVDNLAAHAEEVCAGDCIVKPFNLPELLEKIEINLARLVE